MIDYTGKIIAVDFDGTCVSHAFPDIGKEIGAPPVLQRLVAEGAFLILWTMRSGQPLDEACLWFKKHSIPLWGVNENPEQWRWTQSPKAYAHLYIDDAALGTPLIRPKDARPHVDWPTLEDILFPKPARRKRRTAP
jgi:hypothetical protein